MRRRGTWLVLTALAALALAAVVDAVREHRAPPDGEKIRLSASLRDSRGKERGASPSLSGLLVYADRRCRVFAIGLKAFRPHVPSGTRSCTFRFSPRNRLSFEPELPSPLGSVSARCRRGVVELLARRAVVSRFMGCAPAWKPDGTLNVVRRGEVVAVFRCHAGARCSQPVLSRHDLGGRPVTAVAWLTNTDAAAILRGSRGRYFLAILEGERITARSRPSARLSRLRASPTGRYAAARSEGPAGVIVFDRRLRSWSFLARARAIGWSPDERLAAVAAPDSIEIVGADRLDQRVAGLGFQAVDVAWR